MNKSFKTQYYHFQNISHRQIFAGRLKGIFENALLEAYDSLIFIFIGTDRSTGDSLGPLIGQRLHSLSNSYIHILGTLESPVHAKNLSQSLSYAKSLSSNPFIVAIDASLGQHEHVGMVTLSDGPLYPGSGLNKKLPPVGNMHITGIVNCSGFMDFVILQNTRLALVMKISDFISGSIKSALSDMVASKQEKKELLI